jgi:IS4 transposase
MYNTLGLYAKLEYITMNNSSPCTVFEKIISPLLPLLKEEADAIKNDANTYKLSLFFFSINLLYGIVKMTKSIRLLITEIKTTQDRPVNFELIQVSSSMYSEAFSRYDPAIFRRIFYKLIADLNFMEVAELKSLGRFLCVDGSIFPAFQTMEWAHYKKTANALKIHLAFEINRMLPVSFITTDANSSEKTALLMMLESGVTYIADRGYMSFSLFNQISNKSAFFVIRVKQNLLYRLQEELSFEIPLQWQPYLSKVTDCKIICNNDKESRLYRLLTFVVNEETYFIMTNRFDLKTHEIIMLYAYRWQVELLFRCIKRTFGALHLWSHDPKGVQIHFYIYLIAYVLLLNFKQSCEIQKEELKFQENDLRDNGAQQGRQQEPLRTPPACGMVSILNGYLKNYWKLGIHWLSTIRNLAGRLFTKEIVFQL